MNNGSIWLGNIWITFIRIYPKYQYHHNLIKESTWSYQKCAPWQGWESNCLTSNSRHRGCLFTSKFLWVFLIIPQTSVYDLLGCSRIEVAKIVVLKYEKLPGVFSSVLKMLKISTLLTSNSFNCFWERQSLITEVKMTSQRSYYTTQFLIE